MQHLQRVSYSRIQVGIPFFFVVVVVVVVVRVLPWQIVKSSTFRTANSGSEGVR